MFKLGRYIFISKYYLGKERLKNRGREYDFINRYLLKEI